MYLQDQMGTPLWGAGGSTRSLWNLHSNASFMYIYIYIIYSILTGHICLIGFAYLNLSHSS